MSFSNFALTLGGWGVTPVGWSADNFHLTAVTADQVFVTYSAIHRHTTRGQHLEHVDSEEFDLSLVLSRQLVGSHDDVLDLSLLQSERLLVVAATNSPHIHSMDLSNANEETEGFSALRGCDLMYGHSDVVLAVCSVPGG